MAPLALMRGRSFDNAFIIVDETQNITTHELKMLLTRVGESTTIVLNGDVQQSHLKEILEFHLCELLYLLFLVDLNSDSFPVC